MAARYDSPEVRRGALAARARGGGAGARDPAETAPYRGARVAAEPQRQFSRPTADQLRSQRQDAVRRAAHDLLRELDHTAGPDEPETRLPLRYVAVAIEARREDWPPE
jgi:hypothetical protein